MREAWTLALALGDLKYADMRSTLKETSKDTNEVNNDFYG